ncbi:MAG TPA: 2-oxoglutarate dehydrogenase E1 component [Leptospiraceae bacterium]|nr:2-oxoglutarate dehydrogenase E1 component [Leptospiraceae bacterium]HMX34151.1 2-oxoglutarate dehydrogenase E1 component [Leptospiraceae bacterium]HMY31035.1 2-oxoglutarate dehydrogenase E1 component [Leptospiraceae bacterium]HMZ65986.1 2-oxoglutarate dehydrogenase E1 component [Leptospiraceae bacterium]HNA05838.1 2-oxoglutarate dehydrogenase E1 component [Leptospiraceae bacterium]
MALYADNAELLEEMYQTYKTNPMSLDREWQDFFRELDSGISFSNGTNGKNGHKESKTFFKDTDASNLQDMGLMNLLNAYRRQGHLAANLDPLGILKPDRKFIDQKLSNLKPEDLETIVDSGTPGLGKTKLKNVIEWYEKTYCGSIGSEQYYIVNDEEREWIQNKMESTANSYTLEKNAKLRLFKKLYKADFFEQFLAKKFVGKKRFSLEGGEALIPMLDLVVEEAGRYKMENLVIGMAHRGRLNVLVNTIQKPASLIFAEFEEKIGSESESYADVKYHLGYSNTIKTESGKEVKLSLAFNPSHLEAVNPVVTGSVRARQTLYNDKTREKFMPILIHGDAAFVGQGVVAETLNLMNLEGYTTGGTFHIVINNQIGFTTLPSESRSTLYATDLAKGFQIPIFHVNGDDPEAAYRVVKLALDYRQKFRKDVIIDLICYRRLGHNEMDEPAFTQPYMYNIIKNHPPTAILYEQFLLKEGVVKKEELESIKQEVAQGLEDSFNEAKNKDIKIQVDTMQGVWSNLSKDPLDSEPATKLLKSQLTNIAKAISTIPSGFTANPKLVKLLETRKKMCEGEIPMDWGCAELLSFGSILESGHKVRLSGQDSQRGTFTHRHAILVDINNNSKYSPLNHISDKQASFEVVNASLSEYSVLGFEYGYSLADPNALVIWEAQFGDFANTAQVIFDQFISSSEIKWQRMSGLVVLLPHGYEGQGPEHSSGRLERMLQLCAGNNIQIANCTTPAQYFHLLRRQMLRNYRKPLIIMTPKSLLRLPAAVSTVDDLTAGAFKEVLLDKPEIKPEGVKKILFCSGKVYYDLLDARDKQGLNHIALIRVEQIYPFPESGIKEAVNMYKSATEYAWVQEEPHNQGAWFFVRDFFQHILGNKEFRYYGRKKSPSPAAGHVKVHMKEQEAIVREALS